MKQNVLLEKSFLFAIHTVNIAKYLQSRNEFILSKQLLRSGTSVGANTREANNTLTKKDFIYKLNIAQKECDESIYWIELLYQTNFVSKQQYQVYKNMAEEQLKIIKSIILTTKRNMQ